ncbi:hypothetical protein P4414_04225 [Bacillus thuringiensis]|nr:hypothetical protein [Bacillus thuringiensis]
MSKLIDLEQFDVELLNDNFKKLQKVLDVNELEDVIRKLGIIKNEKVSISSFDYKCLKNIPGIYVFYIKFKNGQNIIEFQRQWDEYKGKDKNNKISAINSSNANTYGNDNDKQEGAEYVLYLGKTESSLEERLSQHIEKCTKGVYALKLFDFPNLSDYDIMCESYFFEEDMKIDDVTVKVLLVLFEKTLHKKMKPLIGTSK